MKLGWIEGLDRVSTQKDDLLAAEETERAGVRTYSEGSDGPRDYDSDSSRDKYRSRGPDYLFADPASTQGANPNRFRGEIVGNLRALLGSPSGRSSANRSPNPRTVTQTNSDGSQIMQETYVDTQTGKLRNRTTETGKVFLINFPNDRDNVFVGYHKTLPVGSRVAINFPDNKGFVEVEIIGALSAQHTEALGLYPDCVKIIFGKFAPENIKFTYSDQK